MSELKTIDPKEEEKKKLLIEARTGREFDLKFTKGRNPVCEKGGFRFCISPVRTNLLKLKPHKIVIKNIESTKSKLEQPIVFADECLTMRYAKTLCQEWYNEHLGL